jgi:RNA 2',3'-cyclic 3'-phosphodiesterase
MRLFVALDLPDEARDAVRELIANLRPLCASARWVRPEGMHVTLKFIGHVPAEKLDPIRVALAGVPSSALVAMHYHGVGFFPNERCPRVVWCGVDASQNLAQLAADIESALEPLGIAPEQRKFVPHLTLARFDFKGPDKRGQSPDGVDKLARHVQEMKPQDFGSARETQFHLYESTLKPSGAEYRKLESIAFVKGAA